MFFFFFKSLRFLPETDRQCFQKNTVLTSRRFRQNAICSRITSANYGGWVVFQQMMIMLMQGKWAKKFENMISKHFLTAEKYIFLLYSE